MQNEAFKIGIAGAKGSFSEEAAVEYLRRYKEDPKLYGSPEKQYKDWPGIGKFLGLKERIYYKTWRQAGRAAKRLGINTATEYRKKWRADKLLHCNPYNYYKDFPGWNKFLGKK